MLELELLRDELLFLLVAASAPETANAQVTATVSAETKNLFMVVTPSKLKMFGVITTGFTSLYAQRAESQTLATRPYCARVCSGTW